MSGSTLPITPELDAYIDAVSLREPALLKALREETQALGSLSRMQISASQGQLMALLIRLLNVKRYLEVGTFTGYSALACALAMPADGRIVACDVSAEWTGVARRYWQQAGVEAMIDLRLAPAADTLQTLLDAGQAAAFDMMFIDADKANYDRYYELGLQLIRPGGLILIDNVLWSGAVLNADDPDPDTQAIRALNEKLHQDERVDLSLIPVADGLTLARKR